MDILDIIKQPNIFLEHYAIFRGFKFIIGTYVIILVVNIVFLLYILLIKFNYINDFSLGHSIPNVKFTMNKKWKEVEQQIKEDSETSWKIAIIEAGEMLYEILKKLTYPGHNLGEQLENMQGVHLTNQEEVAKANEIKNQIVKNANFSSSVDELRKVFYAFGQALLELEAIDEIRIKQRPPM